MAKSKNKKNNSVDDIIINKEQESSLAEFTQRPVPTDDEVEEFEARVDETAYSSVSFAKINDKRGTISLRDDAKAIKELDEEIDESLHEIYQDKNGDMVDVRKMDIKKRHGLLFWLFAVIFIIGVLSGAAFGAYNYFYLGGGTDATAIEFSVEGKSDVVAGEEFFYSIYYKNASNININNVRINAQFPENFIFLDCYPENTGDKRGVWEFDTVAGNRTGKIKIKGMMIGPVNETGIFLTDISYTPENFSSEFKKETSLTTTIKEIGIDFDFDYIESALVGQEDEIVLRIEPHEKNYIDNFRFAVEPQENVELSLAIKPDESEKKAENTAMIEEVRSGVWEARGLGASEMIIPIKFKFKDKLSDKQDIFIFFEKRIEDTSASGTVPARFIRFFEKTLSFEVMKSDLNLTLIVNGSRSDQGVDFNQALNYSIVYNNKGETSMKDVVIMAVLESDFLDWASLKDSAKGRERGNTITWSKEEIPGLEELATHAEGTIDFSINVLEIGDISEGKDYAIKSYAQFSVGEIDSSEEAKETTPAVEEDNRSNTIINKINSDLGLIEAIRYFNADNIPVGTGPHPPKVGESTTYKVYWNLTNNLHELNDLKISVVLPKYVGWAEKDRATVGAITYNSETNEIVWDIGRLPVTVFQANAEFSISITPTEADKNKIMVLLPGSNINAIDNETQAEISDTTKAKTTKLEDDEIARGAGVVE